MEDMLKIKRAVAIILVFVFFVTTSLLFIAGLAEVSNEEVECDNGERIPLEFVNDGENDCSDGSDEEPAANYWQVADTKYSPAWCCTSFILLIIFGLWASKLGKEFELENEFYTEMAEKRRKDAEEKHQAKQRSQRRQELREKASERERALDYDSAIRIWEDMGDIKEAARVRKLKAEQSSVKVDQTVVHGDYVDDRDTIVKDSVINRSNVGGGSSKMQELEKLAEMKDKGIINDDEFKKMKKEILGK